MNAYEYILAKQIAWARRNKISLQGSAIDKGREAYTKDLQDNMFQDLHPETKAEIEKGDGGELHGNATKAAKMSAVHSSSAIGVNVFDYWKDKTIPELAYLLGLCSKDNHSAQEIHFEQKFKISSKFSFDPNIDVVIQNDPKSKIKAFGIECKFSEAYGSRVHPGLKEAYLTDIPEQWTDIPTLFEFAKTISPDDGEFKHLHPAQLVKHILGLKKAHGKDGFRLLYLWYDVLGSEGEAHRGEIEDFKTIAKADGILFHEISYQELIVKMQGEPYETHSAYVDYLSGRYL
jgi:hypothetical protein